MLGQTKSRVVIKDKGGVNGSIEQTVIATGESGSTAEFTCSADAVNPGQKPGREPQDGVEQTQLCV